MPLLARDRVRFIGEKVAVVAAVDPDVAEEALALDRRGVRGSAGHHRPRRGARERRARRAREPRGVRRRAGRAAPPERPVRAPLQAGRRRGRVPRGRSHLRAHLPHAARAPGLSRAARRRRGDRRRRPGPGVGVEQDAPPAEGADVARAPAPAGTDPGQPDAHRRRLRRQGLADGSAARLPPRARDGPAGQDGHALRRGADGGQPAPPLADHDAHRGDERRADRGPAGEGALQQRRLRRVQAGAQRAPGRRGHGRRRLPDPEPPHRIATASTRTTSRAATRDRPASPRWSSPASRTWT